MERGTPPKNATAALWPSLQTTARYAHLARDSIQTAAARITESIGGNLLGEPPERVDLADG